jgi:hypothetical protein
VASTPGAAFGELVPPAEPILLAKMWLSWFGLVFALKKLADCLEENGQGEDAESVRRRLRRVEEEMEKIKQGRRVPFPHRRPFDFSCLVGVHAVAMAGVKNETLDIQ